jgi:hypothetical protein
MKRKQHSHIALVTTDGVLHYVNPAHVVSFCLSGGTLSDGLCASPKLVVHVELASGSKLVVRSNVNACTSSKGKGFDPLAYCTACDHVASSLGLSVGELRD